MLTLLTAPEPTTAAADAAGITYPAVLAYYRRHVEELAREDAATFVNQHGLPLSVVAGELTAELTVARLWKDVIETADLGNVTAARLAPVYRQVLEAETERLMGGF